MAGRRAGGSFVPVWRHFLPEAAVRTGQKLPV